MAVKMHSLEERRRRLEGVQHALLVLGDGKEHAARELFERPENATNPESGYSKADLAWQTRALTQLHDLGLIDRTGAHGPTRKYRLREGASLDPYLDEEKAAFLLWDSGMQVLREQRPSVTPPPVLPGGMKTAIDVEDHDDEAHEDERAVEDEPLPIDPTEDLFGRFLAVLERMDQRLTAIEAVQASASSLTAPAVSSDALATKNDLGDAAVQILQLLDPRLAKIEKEITVAAEAQLHLPAVDMRSLTPALDAMSKRLMNLDSAMHALQTDMTKQVNRTQDMVTKQLVDKKRYDDLCGRIDQLGNASVTLINYTARLLSSLRVLIQGDAGRFNDAVLTGLIDFDIDTKKSGGAG